MYYCRLLCLAVVALSIVPPIAEAAAAYQQRRAFTPSHNEALFLETIPSFFASPDHLYFNLSGHGTSIPTHAPFTSGGASPRRLSIETLFSPETTKQLLGDVGERERAEQEEETRQQSRPFSPSEAVVTPGTQLQTYLPESQRPLSGLTHQNIESPLPTSAERSNDDTSAHSSGSALPRRIANEKATGLVDRVALVNGKLAAHSTVAQWTPPHKPYKGLANALSVGAVGQQDAAGAARSNVSVAKDVDTGRIAHSAEGRLQAQKQSAFLTSAGEKEKQYGNASVSPRSGVASTAARPADWILYMGNRNAEHHEQAALQNRTGPLNTSDASNTGDSHSLRHAAVEHARVTPENSQSHNQISADNTAASSSIMQFLTSSQEKKHETTGERPATAALGNLYSGRSGENQQLATGIYDASATALGSLDVHSIAISRRMEAADLLPTASVVSPASSAPAAPEAAETHRGWWPFGASSSSSTTKQEEEQASTAGTPETIDALSAGLKQAVGTVKNTAAEEAKKAANAVHETAQGEMAKRTGPFSNVLWYLTASKEEKQKAAARAAVDAAVSSLTTNQSAQAAGALPAAYVTEKVSSESGAAAHKGKAAGTKLKANSLTSRFLPQWLLPDSNAQQEAEKALSQASTTVVASPERRNWWFSRDKAAADETTKQQQREMNSSSSSGWWRSAGASATDLKDVADTVQNATEDKVTEVFGTTRESTEEKAKKHSGPLSSLLWFFTSTKQEKKEGAAKAAVKAALSWIADSQQQMQAAFKTLLPASTSQSNAQAATPVASDSDANASAFSGNPPDDLTANVPGFFQLEDVLQRLTARQQQLSTFTDAQAMDWYGLMQQQGKNQGLSAALAAWLYAGSSDDSTKASSPSSYHVQKAQHIGTPPVSSPFFPAGLWSSTTAGGNAQQQQQQQQQAHPLQVGSPSLAPLQWLKDLFVRRGKAYDKPQTVVAANQHEHMGEATEPNNFSSWAGWIGGGHQKEPETQASNLIRKAATSVLTDSQGKILSESSSALLPFANTINWMLPTSNTSNDSEDGSTGSPQNSEEAATRAAADTGAVSSSVSKVALSLQSALLGGRKNEETAHANNEPIRAPGLKPGVYWWEWQAYPSDETSAKPSQPPYMRHIHLDCDPVLPFQACIRECQKESARSLLRSSSNKKKAEETAGTTNGTASTDTERQEPLALGSYEFSTLRSCYLNCKQKWLDRDLPGCLRADGVKVEGVPPAAAYRSTTTTTTTTTTTPPPSPAAAEAVDSSPHQSQGFWSRIRNSKPEDGSDTNDFAEKGLEAGAFSFFRGRMPAQRPSSPAAETEQSRSIKNLFGLLQKREPVPPPTPKASVTESLMNFPQNFWNQLKNGEANAADALGAAATPIITASSGWGADSLQLPVGGESRLAEEVKGPDERSAQSAAVEKNRGGWSFPWTVGETVDPQSSQPVPLAAENTTHARDIDEPKISGNTVKPKLSFKTWCVLLVLCVGGALVSIFLVALRRGEILSRLWMRVQSDRGSEAAASWIRRHFYEQINPLNDNCMQKCMQQVNVRSPEEGLDNFELSKGATQPLIRDSPPYV